MNSPNIPSPVIGSFTFQEVNTYLKKGTTPENLDEYTAFALVLFASLWQARLISLYSVGDAKNLQRVDVVKTTHRDLPGFNLIGEKDADQVREENRLRRHAERGTSLRTPALAEGLAGVTAEADADGTKEATKKVAKKKASKKAVG